MRKCISIYSIFCNYGTDTKKPSASWAYLFLPFHYSSILLFCHFSVSFYNLDSSNMTSFITLILYLFWVSLVLFQSLSSDVWSVKLCLWSSKQMRLEPRHRCEIIWHLCLVHLLCHKWTEGCRATWYLFSGWTYCATKLDQYWEISIETLECTLQIYT